MPPESRPVPRFAAEPPHEPLPSGRLAETLQQELLGACLAIDPGDAGALGEVGEVAWYPERTWHGRTYVPAVAHTTSGLEVFGYVSFVRGDDSDGDPAELFAQADATGETADANPDWTIDICDEVIGAWHGADGAVAAMTLVWGRPLTGGEARIATAELGGTCVDQCPLEEGRFTLLAPDDYGGDTLEVAVWDAASRELARESLYAEDEEDED